MSPPSPLQSLLGGIGLALPLHSLLVLNGSVFGISGFVHSAVHGGKEAAVSSVGLILGGVVVGAVEQTGPGPGMVGDRLWTVILSGLLVGFGTKLSKGCTSGHMIAGISRLSPRSVFATAIFFSSGVLTARVLYEGTLPSVGPIDWTLGLYGETFLALQVIPLAISGLLYIVAPSNDLSQNKSNPMTPDKSTSFLGLTSKPSTHVALFRLIAALTATFNFALALRLSGLSDPIRVIAFLLLPFDKSFDPSLFFVAIGALPLSMLLYHLRPGEDTPRLGSEWGVPKDRNVDAGLIIGAATFGVGWGISGICPGPGLVNLGRALFCGTEVISTALWVSSVAIGGLFVPSDNQQLL